MKRNLIEISPALAALRAKHGFFPGKKGKTINQNFFATSSISEDAAMDIPPRVEEHPANQLRYRALEEKFALFGFSWEAFQGVVRKNAPRNFVQFTNYPTINSRYVTLAELFAYPVEAFDGFEGLVADEGLLRQRGQPQSKSLTEGIELMNALGIGYKGLRGVSWRAGIEPFVLPAALERQLLLIGQAVFVLCDAVRDLYRLGDTSVHALLNYKVPERIPLLMEPGSVDMIRPDIVISQNEAGRPRLVITELESCPAGQAMTHAMQVGYGLNQDMVTSFGRYLNGRPYVVYATHEWSEYIYDQVAFVHALRQLGVDAWMTFDRPLSTVLEKAKSWQAPKDASDKIKQQWDTNVLSHLQQFGFDELIERSVSEDGCPGRPLLPGTVMFRFGYFDNFSQRTLALMQQWNSQGVNIINPLQFPLESKSLMATIKLPFVRQEITSRGFGHLLSVLDQSVAETRVLLGGFWGASQPEQMDEFLRDQTFWLCKFAAWDGNNKSWGSRSLGFGSRLSQKDWAAMLNQYSELPHPTVMQHIIASNRFNVGYVEEGIVNVLFNGKTRLTPFLLRTGDNEAVHAGSTITLRAHTDRIHGATDAVEAPVIFSDSEGGR